MILLVWPTLKGGHERADLMDWAEHIHKTARDLYAPCLHALLLLLLLFEDILVILICLINSTRGHEETLMF